jgi:lipoate-protein ligase A
VDYGKYYITPACDPFVNMAMDEWFFEILRTKSSPCRAIVRLYSWKSGAITIGYNQDYSKAVRRSYLKSGIPVIRRITGGRAIYHDPSEITFSLALNLGILLPDKRSLTETNELITESLIEILNQIGIRAARIKVPVTGQGQRPDAAAKSCFDSLSRFEIVSGSAKVAGGAQRRIGSYFIHQGSLKVNGIVACKAIGQSGNGPEKASEIPAGNCKPYSIGDFSAVVDQVFSRKLGLELKLSRFSPPERRKFENYLAEFKKNRLKRR